MINLPFEDAICVKSGESLEVLSHSPPTWVFDPKLIFKSIWQNCSEPFRLQNKFRFKSNTYCIDVFFVKALANKKSKELWFKMNFKAVKHHSAFLRDKISFLELSSRSLTSWAENWLGQGGSTAMSASLISMVILVMVIFIMRMMLMLITVILMELMTSCVENWLWLHCQPLHGLHNGQDWHR